MSHVARPVIVRLDPQEMPVGPIELLVSHYAWGVEADVRPAGTAAAWTPIQLFGGSIEVREA